MKKIIYTFAIILTVSVLSTSCKKDFLETYPTDAISAAAVTSTTDNAWASLNGIHRALYVRYEGTQGNGGLGSFYIVVDCMAEDHVVNREQWYNQVYKWNAHRNATYYYNRFPWRMFYQWISNANILIDGIDEASGPEEDRNVIKGQSLIYRAFSHYEIVQLYAERYRPGGGNSQPGIPYMMINTPEGQPRVTVEEVYTNIHADLDAAIALLDGMPRNNKSHLNVDVARGLKARVYLTQGNYAQAAQYARDTRNSAQGSYSLMDSVTYYNGFRVDSENEGEYIWASQLTSVDQNDKWAAYGAYISRN
ncbi:MAG: RagB/SusD family nutrient uptake outer membrane protein, partial [Bacteroidales bacterium]|nr:RagB/SusD family nutrient uptake outer membrane protein [Bacteroidales bacterium]